MSQNQPQPGKAILGSHQSSVTNVAKRWETEGKSSLGCDTGTVSTNGVFYAPV